MRILLLTQYYPPEFGAAAARNSEHARFWVEAGHQVEVCTGFPNYPTGIIPKEYSGRFHVLEDTDGVRVHRSWLYATPNRAVWRRALASLTFMLSAFLICLFYVRKPDVVVASSGPFFVGPLGWLVSVFKRVPMVFEVRDILPQQAVDVGMIKNPLVIRILTATEEFLYRQAIRVVPVAEASRVSLAERGVPENKLCTIENGIRDDFFIPAERDNAIRAEYGWGDRFIALYIGVHGVSQGLDTIIEAAALAPDLLFVFVGDGAVKPVLESMVQERNLANVVFLSAQPKERMPGFYAASNACLVPLKKGDYFKINIPSKLFEIMACARPIVLGAEGQARAVVEAAGAGLCVEPENAEEYAAALRRLKNETDFADSLGASGRTWVCEHFTRKAKAHRYLNMLKNALG
jgi:glycosyltransferase involved in cell wall biosynthesis